MLVQIIEFDFKKINYVTFATLNFTYKGVDHVFYLSSDIFSVEEPRFIGKRLEEKYEKNSQKQIINLLNFIFCF